ncbi:hypothetical protein PGT21_021813 [Puccinia graminis f. sp. tritici]|uniref:Uncharacterized protein n=2 Tax=Puccinia graminis f. sp. tritici TaxID=56615 RepID=A0A5B0P9K8_PUCGR|nr:hypothetical protein PGT21_021813 [Puccinia graminis f. sp. tritici]
MALEPGRSRKSEIKFRSIYVRLVIVKGMKPQSLPQSPQARRDAGLLKGGNPAPDLCGKKYPLGYRVRTQEGSRAARETPPMFHSDKHKTLLDPSCLWLPIHVREERSGQLTPTASPSEHHLF